MNKFTIGQMAQLNNVTKKTLLTYEKYELLAPEYVDPETGYRYYTIEQCSLLDSIQKMKHVGLTLSEIKQVLDKKDISYLHGLLKEQDKRLAEEIRSISLARNTAARLMQACELHENKPICNKPVLQWVPERRIIYFPVEPYELGDSRHYASELAGEKLASWEIRLRQIKEEFIKQNLPMQLFYNAGGMISKPLLEQGILNIDGGYVFNPVGIANKSERYFKSGYCLSITTDRVFSDDGQHLERQNLELLLDIVRKENYTLAGDYYCETLAETPAFLYEGRDMMLCQRVPVKVKELVSSPYYYPGGLLDL